MKTTWPLTFSIVAIIGLIGASIYGTASYYTSQSKARFAALSAAGNCQTDVVSPFIQRQKLAHVKPTAEQDFRTFLAAQVQAGLVKDPDAKQALASIESSGQGFPIYTTRGWVMPIIAENISR